MQQLLDFVAGRTFLHGHEPLFRRHDARHRLVEARLKTHIAAGDNADQLAVLRDWHAGNALLARELEDFANGGVGGDGERLADHAALKLLDAPHFLGLTVGSEIFVDNAEPALLRQADSGARLGHRVHGGRQQRDIQAKAAGNPGLETYIPRQNR